VRRNKRQPILEFSLRWPFEAYITKRSEKIKVSNGPRTRKGNGTVRLAPGFHHYQDIKVGVRHSSRHRKGKDPVGGCFGLRRKSDHSRFYRSSNNSSFRISPPGVPQHFALGLWRVRHQASVRVPVNTPSPPHSLGSFQERVVRLDEQGASVLRIGQYVRRWKQWVVAGVIAKGLWFPWLLVRAGGTSLALHRARRF